MTMHKRSQSGLTLAELIVTLSVMSILTVSGIGSLQHFIQENRMAAEINQIVTVLHLARSEAVKHGQRVLLCPSSDSLNCGNSKEWVNGWILFASEDREHDEDERLLQTGSQISPGIRMTSSNHRKRIVYQPDGNSPGTNTSFTFCDTSQRVKPRVICLSNTGRPRLSWTRCDGKPINC